MSGFIFTLGKIDKKLIIPLIYLLIYIFIDLFDKEQYSNITAIYIEKYGNSLGEILVYFISIIVKYAFKKKLTRKSGKQNYLKDFGILFLIAAFYKLNDLLPYSLNKFNKDNDKYKDDNSKVLLVNDALELIIITLVTFLTLKYKYYIHHIISIVIIVIICIVLDFLLNNFFDMNKYTIISSIILILADSFLYSYLKYLIEFKYYFYLDILYIYGIFMFFWNSVALGFTVIIQKINGTNHIFFEFYNYFNTNGAWIVLFRFLFGLIITGLILDLLEYMILNKLTPNYIIICYEIGKIPSNIKNFVNSDYYKFQINNKFLVLIGIIILSVLQVITLLFYLEIFEFNFCSLNKNTKKNIEERELMLTSYNIGMDNYLVDDESNIVMKGYIIEEENRKTCSELTSTEGRNSNVIN